MNNTTTQQQTQTTEQTILFKIDVKTLLDIFKILKDFKKEIHLILTEGGILIKEIDVSCISFLDVEIKKEHLPIFEFKEIIKIGLNTEQFYKIIKEHKKEEVSIFINKQQTEINLKFNMGFNSILSLLNIEHSNPQQSPDNLIFDIEFKINALKFKDIIKNFNAITDNLKIELFNKDNFIKFSCKNDLNKSEVILKDIEDNILIYNKPQTDIKTYSKYSLEYLKKPLNALISEDLNIFYSNDCPILIKQQNKHLTIKYLLAPRIEED